MLKERGIHKKDAGCIRPIQQDNYAQGEGNTKKDATYIRPIQHDNHTSMKRDSRLRTTHLPTNSMVAVRMMKVLFR